MTMREERGATLKQRPRKKSTDSILVTPIPALRYQYRHYDTGTAAPYLSFQQIKACTVNLEENVGIGIGTGSVVDLVPDPH